MAKHKAVKINGIDIDENIVDLITTLWDAGFKTTQSCECGYKEMIWLEFPDRKQFLEFVDVILSAGTFWRKGAVYSAEIRGFYGHQIYFPPEWKPEVIRLLQERYLGRKRRVPPLRWWLASILDKWSHLKI